MNGLPVERAAWLTENPENPVVQAIIFTGLEEEETERSGSG